MVKKSAAIVRAVFSVVNNVTAPVNDFGELSLNFGVKSKTAVIKNVVDDAVSSNHSATRRHEK